ncbi:unnamed protein product [Malus baccata var. baccata]
MAIGRSKIPSNSIPQPLCPDHITNLARMAAVKARDAAEAYFTLGNFEYAIMQAKAAKEFEPDLHAMDNYIAAYSGEARICRGEGRNSKRREAYDKSLKRQFQAAHGSNKHRASECKPPKRSNTFPRKRSSPSGDGSYYKKTIKIIRKSNPGQKATVMMNHVERDRKWGLRIACRMGFLL